jgi:hypothetical protein
MSQTTRRTIAACRAKIAIRLDLQRETMKDISRELEEVKKQRNYVL